MAKVSAKTEVNRDEPKFRYSLELVATIAAHFVDGNTSDKAAADRAINLLDVVSKAIEGKMIWLRARNEAERLSLEIPKHLPFAKGIIWITGKRNQTDATKAFREYLRLNLRLSDLGRPSQLTDEQVKELLEPLPNEKAKTAEETRIEKIMADYRRIGFSQVALGSAQAERDRLQAGLVLPYQNSKKGKMGGRPRNAEKS